MTLKTLSLRTLVLRTITLALLLSVAAVSPSQAARPANPGGSGDQSGGITHVGFNYLGGTIPIGGTKEFAAVTFMAPVTGSALLRGRGSCVFWGSSTATSTSVWVGPGTDASDPAIMDGRYSTQLAVMYHGFDGSYTTHSLGWTAEMPIPIVAGALYTVGLYGKQPFSGGQVRCAGSFVVEIYTGELE